MFEGEFGNLRTLIYFASAKRRLSNARMAASHCSFEMAYGEGRAAMNDLIRLSYILAMKPLDEPIQLRDFTNTLQVLKMTFSEIEFFDTIRSLSHYFDEKREGESIQEQFDGIDVLLQILAKYVGEATGFEVGWYDKRNNSFR